VNFWRSDHPTGWQSQFPPILGRKSPLLEHFYSIRHQLQAQVPNPLTNSWLHWINCLDHQLSLIYGNQHPTLHWSPHPQTTVSFRTQNPLTSHYPQAIHLHFHFHSQSRTLFASVRPNAVFSLVSFGIHSVSNHDNQHRLCTHSHLGRIECHHRLMRRPYWHLGSSNLGRRVVVQTSTYCKAMGVEMSHLCLGLCVRRETNGLVWSQIWWSRILYLRSTCRRMRSFWASKHFWKRHRAVFDNRYRFCPFLAEFVHVVFVLGFWRRLRLVLCRVVLRYLCPRWRKANGRGFCGCLACIGDSDVFKPSGGGLGLSYELVSIGLRIRGQLRWHPKLRSYLGV